MSALYKVTLTLDSSLVVLCWIHQTAFEYVKLNM